MSVVCWTDKGGCSTCKYCVGMDMDMDPYCLHPKVIEKYKYGLSLNSAIQHFCTPKLIFRQEKENKK